MLLHILLAILIIVAVSLTAIILLQKSEGGALGVGGGGGQFMSARGASDLLTQTTQVLAGLFFVLSLVITILTGRATGTASVVDRVTIDRIDPTKLNQPAAPGITAPAPTVGSAAAGFSEQPAPAQGSSLGFGVAPAPTTAPAPTR